MEKLRASEDMYVRLARASVEHFVRTHTYAALPPDMPEELTQEVSDLVDAALADLKQAGVSNLDTQDPLIRRAVITYCRANFWPTGDYDKLKASYDEQKAQLRMTTNYTDWPDA